MASGVVDMGDGTFKATDNHFNENQVKAMLHRSKIGTKMGRWLSVGGPQLGIKLNWVTTIIAVILTWGFAMICLVDKANAGTNFGNGKKWVSQNFTWLYILTQDVWCLFLIYLCFSRFAKIKLGKDNEVPRYNDFTWFSMLFTCGVAVGLYVFGVAEPLYFYRQPTSWLPGSSYAHTKVSIDNDANRAQQAIFMAVYHWGIHGWVPYILLALTAGITSFRWGLPMTIRSCFYPLLGDHALGLLGDLIDSLSIATTTFGVCTSLGLGVTQLSRGLGFVKNIGCSKEANCVAAGGTWSIAGYGKENCAGASSAYDACTVSWLATPESTTSSLYVLIIVISFLATGSVISGIDRGIKTLALAAIFCGFVVMTFVVYADNTWYLLNIMVQTTGYYLQYVIQVGFDCEAFQQQAFEWQAGGGKLWMSEPISARMQAVGLNVVLSSSDCGSMTNPCKQGILAGSLAAAVLAGGSEATAATQLLTAFKMSAKSIADLKATKSAFSAASIYGIGIPCGSGWNSTHFDTFTARALGGAADTDLPAAVKSAAYPRCPETVIKDVPSWGHCEKFQASCPTQQTMYGDTQKMFMDWWTIFYWAWWITWAPFVGFFVALISRGRTVREVIVGGFICPTLYAIMWFGVFGGLAIKMERTAEMALQVRPDVANGGVTCSEHYSGGVPITPEAKKLAQAGYYMLTCIPKDDQIYRIMEPYTNCTGFLQFFLWLGLVIYFLTSSDSGSMTDDIISASGLSANKIPAWQKVFWCWTEGLVAIALVNTGGALKSLQALSIVIGLPYTFLLCMMVPSLYRLVKKEAGDQDIATSYKFNTQLGDIFELWSVEGSPAPMGTHLKNVGLALLCPFLSLWKVWKHLYPSKPVQALLIGVTAQLLHLTWLIFMILEWAGAGRNAHNMAWLWFTFFLAIVTFTRVEMRYKHKVWGSVLDDFFVGLFLWPLTLNQVQIMAETDGSGKPLYWADADALIAEMQACADGSTELKKVETQTEVSTV